MCHNPSLYLQARILHVTSVQTDRSQNQEIVNKCQHQTNLFAFLKWQLSHNCLNLVLKASLLGVIK
jgi:hypothetical protein